VKKNVKIVGPGTDIDDRFASFAGTECRRLYEKTFGG